MTKDLSKIAKQKKIKYFLISFVDLFGVLRSKLVPSEAIKGMQVAGEIYPMVGTEGWLLLISVIAWLAWHAATSSSEAEEQKKLARKAPGANAHKSNITEW